MPFSETPALFMGNKQQRSRSLECHGPGARQLQVRHSMPQYVRDRQTASCSQAIGADRMEKRTQPTHLQAEHSLCFVDGCRPRCVGVLDGRRSLGEADAAWPWGRVVGGHTASKVSQEVSRGGMQWKRNQINLPTQNGQAAALPRKRASQPLCTGSHLRRCLPPAAFTPSSELGPLLPDVRAAAPSTLLGAADASWPCPCCAPFRRCAVAVNWPMMAKCCFMSVASTISITWGAGNEQGARYVHGWKGPGHAESCTRPRGPRLSSTAVPYLTH